MQQRPKRRFVGCTIIMICLVILTGTGLGVAAVIYQDTELLIGLGMVGFLLWSVLCFAAGGLTVYVSIRMGGNMAIGAGDALAGLARTYKSPPPAPFVVNPVPALPGGGMPPPAYTTGNYDIVVDGLEEDD